MNSSHIITNNLKVLATTVCCDSSTPSQTGQNGSHIDKRPSMENGSLLTTEDYQLSFMDVVIGRLEWKIAMMIISHGMIVISCIGIIGNFVSLGVLCRKSMRVTSCAFLLISLAVADELASTMNMFNTLNDNYLKGIFYSDAWCKITGYLTSTIEFSSVWILIAMTTERFFAVCFPLKLALWHTRRSLVVAVILIATLSLLQGIPMLLTIKAVPGAGNLACGFKAKYEKFWGIWNWCLASLISYVPIILLTSLNSALLRSLRKAAAVKTALSTSSQASSISQTKQVTKMCLAVSIVFTLCLLPIACHRPISHFMLDKRNPVEFAIHRLIESISWSLLSLNHSVNFFIYCVTGKRFRDELHALCCWNTASPTSIKQIQTSMSNMSSMDDTVRAGGSQTTCVVEEQR